jgi:dihydroxy-acid dehydratase
MQARANPWQPAKPRKRNVTTALRAYAALTTSAARGAVRDVDQLTRRN